MPSKKSSTLSVLQNQTTCILHGLQEKAVRIPAQDIRDPSPLLPQLQWKWSHPGPKVKASKDRKEWRKVGKADVGCGEPGRPWCPSEDWNPAQHGQAPVILFSSPPPPQVCYCCLLRAALIHSFSDFSKLF